MEYGVHITHLLPCNPMDDIQRKAMIREGERRSKVANGLVFFKPLSQLRSYRGVLDRQTRVYHDILYMQCTPHM